jgi:probable addiction module antidote protein
MRKKRIQESAMPTGSTARAGAAAEKLDKLLARGRDPEFLDALRQLTTAHGGVAIMAAKAGLSRPGLYRSLSPAGNPELGTITAVPKVLGLRFSVSTIRGDGAERTKQATSRRRAARR